MSFFMATAFFYLDAECTCEMGVDEARRKRVGVLVNNYCTVLRVLIFERWPLLLESIGFSYLYPTISLPKYFSIRISVMRCKIGMNNFAPAKVWVYQLERRILCIGTKTVY